MGKLLVLLFIFPPVIALSGQSTQQSPDQCFDVHGETIHPVIAYQSDCPIEFTKVRVVGCLGGGNWYMYQIRNRSMKPIIAYTINTITSAGTGNEASFIADTKREQLMPGEIRPTSMEKSWRVTIVPNPDKLKPKSNANNIMKGIVIYMIRRVEFADGSIYNGEQEYKFLKNFFNENPIFPNLPRKQS